MVITIVLFVGKIVTIHPTIKELYDKDEDSVLLVDYLESILWTDTDESTPSGGYTLDKNYSILDFTKEAVLKANNDCESFMKLAIEILEEYDWTAANVARNFWLTKNHHGSGFWDDNTYEKQDRDKLTNISHQFSENYTYINENEQIEIE